MGKALFYAIKKKDWKHAFFLLDKGSPICKVYELEKGDYISTTGLLIKMMCAAIMSKGYKMLEYKIPDRLLDIFIVMRSDLRCHCSSKFPHRCPLFVALNELGIRNEEEIFAPKNVLVRKLI